MRTYGRSTSSTLAALALALSALAPACGSDDSDAGDRDVGGAAPPGVTGVDAQLVLDRPQHAEAE